MAKEITLDELRMWHDALANCAIEGNKYAIEQLGLWDTDREAFIREYIRQENDGRLLTGPPPNY